MNEIDKQKLIKDYLDWLLSEENVKKNENDDTLTPESSILAYFEYVKNKEKECEKKPE